MPLLVYISWVVVRFRSWVIVRFISHIPNFMPPMPFLLLLSCFLFLPPLILSRVHFLPARVGSSRFFSHLAQILCRQECIPFPLLNQTLVVLQVPLLFFMFQKHIYFTPPLHPTHFVHLTPPPPNPSPPTSTTHTHSRTHALTRHKHTYFKHLLNPTPFPLTALSHLTPFLH